MNTVKKLHDLQKRFAPVAVDPIAGGSCGEPERINGPAVTLRRARNYNYQLVGALLVQARQEFVKEIGRDPKIKFCAELKALIPLYQQAVAEYKLSGVRFEHRYEKETYPLELKRALDQCTERNGYSDGWFRGAAAETLHIWSFNPASAETNYIFVPYGAFSTLQEGVLPPFVFQATAWSAVDDWPTYRKQLRVEYNAAIETYYAACLEVCPSLSERGGSKAYAPLAQFQASIKSRSDFGPNEWRDIRRTAHRLGLTLRAKTKNRLKS